MSTDTLRWIVIAVACWLLLAVICKPLIDGIRSLAAAGKNGLQHLADGLNSADSGRRRHLPALMRDVLSLGNAVPAVLEPIARFLNRVLEFVRGLITAVLTPLLENARSPAQRVLGALLYMAAALLFIYTDAALGLNTATTIMDKADIPPPSVPGWLTDLTVPLVVAFMVNVFMLGVILGDLYGHTDFARWDPSGPLIALYRRITFANLFFVIVLAAGFMLARFVELTPAIGQEGGLADFLNTIASLAMNLITVSALITTFLLWPGILGIFVGSLIILGIAYGSVRLMLWFVGWGQEIAPLAAKAFATLLGWLAAVLGAVLRLFAWISKGLQMGVDAIVALIELLLRALTDPAEKIWDWLVRIDFIAIKLLRLRSSSAEEHTRIAERLGRTEGGLSTMEEKINTLSAALSSVASGSQEHESRLSEMSDEMRRLSEAAADRLGQLARTMERQAEAVAQEIRNVRQSDFGGEE